MNSQHFHGWQYPLGYLGYACPTGAPFYPPSGGLRFRHGFRNYQQQQQQFHRAATINKLAVTYSFYNQFLQIYNFKDSQRFHPNINLHQPLKCNLRRESRVRRSASSSDINKKVQEDILAQQVRNLTICGGSFESVTTESTGSYQSLTSSKTGEESPDYAESVPGDLDCGFSEDIASEEEDESGMHARGVKRQPDQRARSPMQKRPRSEERESTPISKGPWSITHCVLNKDEYERISHALVDFYDKQEQAPDLYIKKMKLRDALYEVMRGVFPYCGLYVVGSSMNGFGSHTSDMDLCLMLSYNEIDQRKEATEILRCLLKALKKCTFLSDLNLIRAKVPILKFFDTVSQVECDLNINNSVGIRNTHLLSAYSKLDQRVSCLVLFVKHWAKIQNINDASQGTISSYSLVLMVIHYLQCGTNPPVIPSLQVKYPHKFDATIDIRLLTLNEKLPPYTSPNKDTLGELFVGFMEYYATKFNYTTDAISIRLGRRLPKEVIMKQNPIGNPPNQWKCLCIEEPFNLSNTARSIYDQYIFQHIKQVFCKTYRVLRQEGDVKSILSTPL